MVESAGLCEASTDSARSISRLIVSCCLVLRAWCRGWHVVDFMVCACSCRNRLMQSGIDVAVLDVGKLTFSETCVSMVAASALVSGTDIVMTAISET